MLPEIRFDGQRGIPVRRSYPVSGIAQLNPFLLLLPILRHLGDHGKDAANSRDDAARIAESPCNPHGPPWLKFRAEELADVVHNPVGLQSIRRP